MEKWTRDDFGVWRRQLAHKVFATIYPVRNARGGQVSGWALSIRKEGQVVLGRTYKYVKDAKQEADGTSWA